MRYIKTITLSLMLTFSFIFCWKLILQLMDETTPANETTQMTDPIFGVTINGDDPQRVHVYESGDDIKPDLYEVIYFPELVTNGKQGHYEVYRTMGKDR